MLPGANGGEEWSPIAVNPDLGYAYTVGLHQRMFYKTHYAPWEAARLWLGSAFVAILLRGRRELRSVRVLRERRRVHRRRGRRQFPAALSAGRCRVRVRFAQSEHVGRSEEFDATLMVSRPARRCRRRTQRRADRTPADRSVLGHGGLGQ